MNSPCGHSQAECVIGSFWKCPICDAPKITIKEDSCIPENELHWGDVKIELELDADFYADDSGNCWPFLPSDDEVEELSLDTTWSTIDLPTWTASSTYEDVSSLSVGDYVVQPGIESLPPWAKLGKEPMAADPDLMPVLHQLYKEAGFGYKSGGFEYFLKVQRIEDSKDYLVTAVVDGKNVEWVQEETPASMHSYMCTECDAAAGKANRLSPVFRTLDFTPAT